MDFVYEVDPIIKAAASLGMLSRPHQDPVGRRVFRLLSLAHHKGFWRRLTLSKGLYKPMAVERHGYAQQGRLKRWRPIIIENSPPKIWSLWWCVRVGSFNIES